MHNTILFERTWYTWNCYEIATKTISGRFANLKITNCHDISLSNQSHYRPEISPVDPEFAALLQPLTHPELVDHRNARCVNVLSDLQPLTRPAVKKPRHKLCYEKKRPKPRIGVGSGVAAHMQHKCASQNDTCALTAIIHPICHATPPIRQKSCKTRESE